MVHIAAADAGVAEIGREILRHFLCKRGDERALALRGAEVDLPDQVVDLSLHGADLHLGIQKPRRADDLLGDLSRALIFILSRRRGHIDRLLDPLLKFLKLQGPVIER